MKENQGQGPFNIDTYENKKKFPIAFSSLGLLLCTAYAVHFTNLTELGLKLPLHWNGEKEIQGPNILYVQEVVTQPKM